MLRLAGLGLRVEDLGFSPNTGELNVNKNGKTDAVILWDYVGVKWISVFQNSDRNLPNEMGALLEGVAMIRSRAYRGPYWGHTLFMGTTTWVCGF